MCGPAGRAGDRLTSVPLTWKAAARVGTFIEFWFFNGGKGYR